MFWAKDETQAIRRVAAGYANVKTSNTSHPSLSFRNLDPSSNSILPLAAWSDKVSLPVTALACDYGHRGTDLVLVYLVAVCASLW
jgi:hypothetical protein